MQLLYLFLIVLLNRLIGLSYLIVDFFTLEKLILFLLEPESKLLDGFLFYSYLLLDDPLFKVMRVLHEFVDD